LQFAIKKLVATTRLPASARCTIAIIDAPTDVATGLQDHDNDVAKCVEQVTQPSFDARPHTTTAYRKNTTKQIEKPAGPNRLERPRNNTTTRRLAGGRRGAAAPIHALAQGGGEKKPKPQAARPKPQDPRHRTGKRTTQQKRFSAQRSGRRTAASKLATWIFAAIAASGIHVENVLGAVSEFVSRRRDLETALAELPNAFGELPTDEMTALQEQYLLASRMAGMLQTRGSIGRSVNRQSPGADFRFEILKDRVGPAAANTDRALALITNAEINFEAIPFVEALEALRDRLGLTPDEFEALEVEARSRAFRVAAVWDMKLLSDIHRELAASIEAGETSRDFRRRLPEMAIRNGWSGENPWHADVVHFQNFAMAHAAGRYGEYREFGIEHWRFVANGDSCPICAPQVGKVFKLSDRRFFPPLHFWCDCEDEAVFEGEAGDGEVIDSGAIDNPQFDKQRARASGFTWDPAQYARLEPVNLSAIEPALQGRFESFANEQGWEVVR